MSFPRHWTVSDRDGAGEPMEYTAPAGLRIVRAHGRARPWRISSERGMYACGQRGRARTFATAKAAAEAAERGAMDSTAKEG